MSDYVKSTDFASKDTLPSGDSAKIVRGTEIDAEFEALEVAIASKANTSDVSSTYAPLNSPTFTGSPVLPTGTTAVTQTAGDNDTSVATTAFVTTAVATAVANVGYPAFKNRIINGAMMIDQRNAGASVTPTTSAQAFAVDRTSVIVSQNSKLTAQQNAGSVTPPAGFTNYLGVTSSSAYSVLTGDYFFASQAVEGFNIADFGWGAASAQTVTLSFWVRSSLTGTHSGSLRNSATNRSYVFTFSVSSANTWEQKSITIAGDTSGTWLTNNGVGVYVSFSLGAGSTYSTTAGSWASGNFIGATGSTSVVGTNGATFYITGVQLEKGSTATSFDYRPYGTELALCQRYYYVSSTDNSGGGGGVQFVGNAISSALTIAIGQGRFPVTMRTAPTVTLPSGCGQSGLVADTTSTAGQIGTDAFVRVTIASGAWSNSYTPVQGRFTASAEL